MRRRQRPCPRRSRLRSRTPRPLTPRPRPASFRMWWRRHEVGAVHAPTSNWNRLVRPADPAVAPLDLARAKSHLRVDSADEDADIQDYLDDAIAAVDGPNGAGLALITQTWRMSLDSWQHGRITIPLRPVQEIVSITYLD